MSPNTEKENSVSIAMTSNTEKENVSIIMAANTEKENNVSITMSPNTKKENSISITVDEEKLSFLAVTLQETLPKKGSHICSIYRVSDKLRSGKGELYNACFVSIGPYHRTNKNFMVTEHHKRWYLHNLIGRLPVSTTILPKILRAMKNLEAEARDCYAEETNMSSDEFVTMMMVDGCFMLELFYKYKEAKPALGEDEEVSVEVQKVYDDLIFSSGNVIRRIRMDFILLENQLPLVVLRKLFELTRDPKHNCSLIELIMNFLGDIIPTSLIQNSSSTNVKHLLDLVRTSIIPSQKNKYGKQYPLYNTARYSATQLHEVGVIFKKNEAATSFMDIQFDVKTGVLKIPYFSHGKCLAGLIPNLIALEKAHLPYTKEITSYALFLDTLVNTKEDVKLLSNGGIIYNGGATKSVTRNEEEIANEINNICQGLGTKMFYYEELCNKINCYCQIGWPRIKRFIHRWKVTLHRDYFSAPWAILSPIAAIILLVLTLMQTIYSERSYSHKI